MIDPCNLQTVLTKLEVVVLLTSADLDHPGFNNNLATYSDPLFLLNLSDPQTNYTYLPLDGFWTHILPCKTH